MSTRAYFIICSQQNIYHSMYVRMYVWIYLTKLNFSYLQRVTPQTFLHMTVVRRRTSFVQNFAISFRIWMLEFDIKFWSKSTEKVCTASKCLVFGWFWTESTIFIKELVTHIHTYIQKKLSYNNTNTSIERMFAVVHVNITKSYTVCDRYPSCRHLPKIFIVWFWYISIYTLVWWHKILFDTRSSVVYALFVLNIWFFDFFSSNLKIFHLNRLNHSCPKHLIPQNSNVILRECSKEQ